MYFRTTAAHGNRGSEEEHGRRWRKRPLPNVPSSQIVERTPSYSSQDHSPYKIDHLVSHSMDSLPGPGSQTHGHYHRYYYNKSRPAESTSIYSTQTERRRTQQFEPSEPSTPSYSSSTGSLYQMSNLAAIHSTDSLHDPYRFVPPRKLAAPNTYDSSQFSVISNSVTTRKGAQVVQRRYTFFSPEPDTKRPIEVDTSPMGSNLNVSVSEFPVPPPLPIQSLQRPGVVFQFGPGPHSAAGPPLSRPVSVSRRMAKRADLYRDFEPILPRTARVRHHAQDTSSDRGIANQIPRSASTPPDQPADPDSSFWVDDASEVEDAEWYQMVGYGDAYEYGYGEEEITYARQRQREKAKEADVFRARVKDFFGFK